MKIVVTGGAGQLGSRVLRRLADERGVKAITCVDVRPPAVASPKIRAVIADVRDPDIGRHIEGHDALVHLAFVVTEARPRAEVDSINVAGSANVFAAAARAGVTQIVYSSSIAAYGVVPGHPEPIIESTPRVHQPEFAYAATKFEVEAALDVFEAQYPGIAVARLRPAILVGHDMDHALGVGLRRGQLVEVGTENGAPLPIVWDEDVSDAVALAVLGGKRGAFNLAADSALPLRELAAEGGLRLLRVPLWLARGFVVASAWLARLGVGRATDPAWLDHAGARMVISSERAKRELGWRPRCPTAADVIRRHQAEVPRRLDRRIALFFRMVALASRGRAAESGHSIGFTTHLRITGPEGGDRTIVVDRGRLSIRRGVPRPPAATVTLTTQTFRRLLTGDGDVTTAQFVGDLRVEGEPAASMLLAAIFAGFRAAGTVPGWRGKVMRRLAAWFSHARPLTPPPAPTPAREANP
ncbi:MAG TPA: NAD-dependent epimerase/dehydratase family protein [Polyangia bacterium]|nr:NAD-dependent epimerase/dehydratase family protein [Polyangia bacterium]